MFTLKRYLKEIYCDIKFLSDEGTTYNCPDFVRLDSTVEDSEKEYTQTLQIAEHLFEKLGKFVCY